MGTTADTLGTTYFQLSTVGVGALAVGIADIRQRIFNVLNTIPGTDPLRPLFGSYAYQWTDKPLADAIPNIKKDVFEALSIWMPEIQVNSLTHNIINEGQVGINITYTLIDSDLADTLSWVNGVLTGEIVSNAIILTAAVPAQVVNGIYRVVFIVNGEAVSPAIPDFGFSSAAEMLTWINTNWSGYGRWYLTGTSLILYLNSGIAETASLTVTETAELTIKKLVPELSTGAFYNLALVIDGNPAFPAFPAGTVNNPGALLGWVLTNWGAYGSWHIAATSTGGDGDGDYAILDFNDDFDNGNNVYTNYYLVYQSAAYTTATLTFS